MKRWKLINYRGEKSQLEMAKKYGVTQQTWSKWETGERTPGRFLMKRLERDLHIPMENIFYDFFYGLDYQGGKHESYL